MNDEDKLDAEMREVMELIGERCEFAYWIDDYFDTFDDLEGGAS